MNGVTIPHFSLPFRFAGATAKAAVVVEQDSSAEIADCVRAVLLTLKGQRIENPAYGISDPTFQRGDQVAAELLDEITPWEPRADLTLLTQDPEIQAALDMTITSAPVGG